MLKEMSTIVKEVGDLLLSLREGRSNLKGKWKNDQFKIKADLIVHNALVERLKKLEPNIPIISEEDPSSLTLDRPKHYWLIDPIDGTASFAHGYPGYVTQIALIKNKVPYVAAIYAPEIEVLFSAVRGKGAFLNGNKINRLTKSKMITLIDNTPKPEGIAHMLYDAFGFTRYIECGSISLKICRVADGTVDVFVKDVTIRDWDLAAPQLVLEESGGFISDIRGNSFNYQGSYDHHGLVVTCSNKLGESIVQWYKNK